MEPVVRAKSRFLIAGILTSVLLSTAQPASAERVKDLTQIAGIRDNQLIGYGLVVGLDGTGDKTNQAPFTVQSLKNMLQQLGIDIQANINPQLKNVAAVTLSATLPAFAKPGQSLDVTVSTIGNAKSLRGGTLLMSPLKGADGRVYAIAQGNLVVGGVGVESGDGDSISVNIPTVGRVPNGASVERPAPTAFGDGNYIVLNLHRPDFTTANRVADAINDALGMITASPMDSTSIRVRAPLEAGQRVTFVSMIENVSLEPGQAPARVIVNARTGTVVIGHHVRVFPAAVAHGNLSVTIANDEVVSQPGPFSRGQTTEFDDTDIEVSEERSRAFVFNPGASLDDIVRAINRVGAAPSDLVSILEALKRSGALRAELVVM
jgi:flagellar P-ring protein precursor FlgI